MRKGHWTAEEIETLHRMRKERRFVREIATALDRTIQSVRDKLTAANTTEDQREARRRKRHKWYGKKYEKTVHDSPQAILASRPTAEMLAERDRRYALPEPMLGDPLPGFSALDKMSSGAVDKLR